MKEVLVVYWSGTGNTEQMAFAIAEGARSEGASVNVVKAEDAVIAEVLKADAVALGCSAMGDEVLEEDTMEPFVQSLEKENLKGKPVLLFGSYGWGDGAWMRDWSERMEKLGVHLVDEGLIIQETPEEEGIEACKKAGVKLAAENG